MLLVVKQALFDRFPGAKLVFENGDSVRLVGMWWEFPVERIDEIHDANWLVAGLDVRTVQVRRRMQHSLLSWDFPSIRRCAVTALTGKSARWESLEQSVRIEFVPRISHISTYVRVLRMHNMTTNGRSLPTSRAALADFAKELAALEAAFPRRSPPDDRRRLREETLRKRAADPSYSSLRLGEVSTED